MKHIPCVAFGLLFLQATVAMAELDPIEKYENFNAKNYNGCKRCIDSEKFRGGERGNYTMEIVRDIRSKRGHLKHRSWGNTDSDDGTETGRNRLIFRNSENFSGVCFTPRVLKYDINNCAANGSTASAQIRYVGNFYDADNNLADDGENGLVYAWFGLRRWSDGGDKKGIFEVSGNASQCGDEDCNTDAWSTYDNVDDPDLFFEKVKGSNNKKEFCVGYDRINHEIVFSFGNEVKTVNGPDHGLPALAADVGPDFTWHVLEARTDVHNCTAGQLSGYVDGDFDNVKIRQFP